MFLKDVVYKQAMERAEGGESDSESDDGPGRSDDDLPAVQTYTQEQQELKAAFLDAFKSEVGKGNEEAEEDAEFGGVLKPRKKGAAAGGGGGAGGTNADADADDQRVQELLDMYFAGDEKRSNSNSGAPLDEGDQFLRNFILNRGWVETDGGARDGSEGEGDDFEDEAAVEAAEAYEAQYNFRFEEPTGAQLITYPRQVEGVVRKEDDRRKRKRAEKAARKEAEEEARRAEVRRLKNLKKAEIEEQLAEVKSVAGVGGPDEDLLDKLLGGDFDPEEHDRAMAAAFGDDYYDAEDDDIADAQFEKELADMAEYPSDDEAAPTGSFAAVHAKVSKQLKKKGGAEESESEDDGGLEGDEDEDGEGGAGAAAAREDVKRLIEEYHKLDYEDYVGGVPTRFRYKEVEPETYGLSIAEILALDDKELNQVMGLKRVAAPYRQGPKMRPNYGKLNELRNEKGWGRGYGGRRDGGSVDRGPGKVSHHKKSGEEGGKEPAPVPKKTEAEKRLATFETPSLKKRGRQEGHAGGEGASGKKSKKAKQPQQQQEPAPGSGHSKAQKKNLKRSAKRAAKRASAAASM